MTKTEIMEILTVQASQVIVNRNIKSKYGSIIVGNNTELYLHVGDKFFFHIIEMLDHVVVTFNPKWNNGDSDYLEGWFNYDLAGHTFRIFALIPKTKEE